MSVFNFNSSICTSREQSERLLALGLKRETADCALLPLTDKVTSVLVKPSTKDIKNTIPAWSLHRLIEMLRSRINISKDLPSINHDAYLRMYKASVSYIWFNCDGEEKILVGFYDDGFFGAVVDAIEWLIKEGYLKKEYLENGNC